MLCQSPMKTKLLISPFSNLLGVSGRSGSAETSLDARPLFTGVPSAWARSVLSLLVLLWKYYRLQLICAELGCTPHLLLGVSGVCATVSPPSPASSLATSTGLVPSVLSPAPSSRSRSSATRSLFSAAGVDISL